MDHLTIYKASAGSGKTFRLTGEYLKLIFNPEQKFHSILAVTFTNKATAEMRERILKELHCLSIGNRSDHGNDLKNIYKLSDKELKYTAKNLLNQILHNYSRFNVSTIDSFFQKILKAFAYETGLSTGFNIELNIKSILEISIEQFFDNINDKKELKDWLSNYAIQKIVDGKSWDIEKDIFGFSNDAFNEVFFSFSELQLEEFSHIENFKSYKKKLSFTISSFINQMRLFGSEANAQINQHNLEISDFTNGNTGIAGFLTKLEKINQFSIKEPGVRVLKASNSTDGIEGWCTKTSAKKQEIQACVNGGLANTLKKTLEYFNANFESFSTAKAIYKGIDVFAVIVEVFNQMNSYCREKNIFLLPMASPLLSKMIGHDDAPFIYEKTGEYLKYFMIDEFQDTSNIQWNNFSPLFLNAISQGNESLVVGDVKQSIYRWRNGDWTLLNHKLANQFEAFGVKEINLEYNWRSTPEIIGFNNWIFHHISDLANNYLINKKAPDEITNSYFELISNIYKSAAQEVPDKNAHKKGFVSFQFLEESKDTNENNQWYLDKMLDAITQLIDKGTEPKDIAILVRRKKEGSMVAKHLMEYIKKHPNKKDPFCFVSNDSVLLGSSTIILLTIALLEFLANAENKECRASILYFYFLLTQSATDAAKKLAEIDINNLEAFLECLPTEFVEKRHLLNELPLQAIINKLLNIFIYSENIENISLQLPFIHTFQDIVLNHTQNNGSDISGFLIWWKDFGVDTPINLSEDQNAIRIITIHKSKGLEYKSVIIPFANWGLDQLSKYIWCKTPDDFNQFSIVPIRYSSGLANTTFSHAYWSEKTMALMDNLNLLYVAFTRAIKSLHIMAPKPQKEGDFRKISDILYAMLNNSDKLPGKWDSEQFTFIHGELSQEPNEVSKKIENKLLPIQTYGGRNIKINLSADKYFKNAEGEVTKKINKGSIYHTIMEQIITGNDINKAIENASHEGLLNKYELDEFRTVLQETIEENKTRNWFNNSYKVLNETSIILNNGSTKRPDRVMIGKDNIIIIDYKFTQQQNKNHLTQVKEYMNQIKQIEKAPVAGYVWYVLDKVIVEVK